MKNSPSLYFSVLKIEEMQIKTAKPLDWSIKGVSHIVVIRFRSTTSELLLECEEEELEPWQKQTSQVDLKDEDDVGELSM